MRKTLMIVGVVVVIAILIIGYMAVVGVNAKQPPVGPVKDPTGAKREPIAAGNLFLTLNIHNNILGASKVTIEDFHALIVDWTPDSQALEAYWNEKSDPLGLFGSNTYTVVIKCNLLGPNKWIADWGITQPATFDIRVGEGDHKVVTKESGPMKFYDPGTYTGNLEIYIEGVVKATQGIEFTVTV